MKTSIEKMTVEQLAKKLKSNRIIGSLIEKEEKAIKALLMDEKPTGKSSIVAGKYIINYVPGSRSSLDIDKLAQVFGADVYKDKFKTETTFTSIKILDA